MYFPPALHKELVAKMRPKPGECFYCESDRKIDVPEGGWIYTGNNGPYVPCPICNPDGAHKRS